MKIILLTDRTPLYLNRSGYIRTMIGEELQARGHFVLYDPNYFPPDVDFVIATDPSNYVKARGIYERTHVPTLVLCHDVPLDEGQHELFKDTFDSVFRVIAVSKTTFDAVTEKWGTLNMDWLHFGFDELIYDNTAVREFRDHLVVVGDNAPHRRVQDAIDAAEKFGMPIVRIDGQEDWYKAIQIKSAFAVIHPSSYGGFNITPMEALYNKIPIVISDIPCHREFYQGYGHFFRVGNVDGIVNILKGLEKGDWIDADQKREYAEKFTRQAMGDRIEQYLYTLKSCIDGTVFNHKYLEGKVEVFGKKIGYDENYMNYKDDPIWLSQAMQLKAYLDLAPGGGFGKRIIDFGCAEGFLVDELWELGVASFGVDPALNLETLTLRRSLNALDPVAVIHSSETLEHIYEWNIPALLTKFNFWLHPGGYFVGTICIDNNNDFTHITLKPREWWHKQFLQAGFVHDKELEDRFNDNKLRKEWQYFVYKKI